MKLPSALALALLTFGASAPAELTAAEHPFAGEQGRIERCGAFFCDEAGRTWDWRGATMFTLFARHLRGEDIEPQIQWMRQTGVNVARVFVAGVTWSGWEDYVRPYQTPDYEARLGAFFDRMAKGGLRVEATVVTDQRPLEEWRGALQSVYKAAASRWNVFVEVENEPWVHQVDPVELVKGVNRHGVLSAYGIQPAIEGGKVQPVPVLDYLTVHLPRDDGFPYNSRDAGAIRSALNVPVIDDETLGIADFIREGAGARTNDRDEVLSHFAICRLYANGCTIHYEAGLQGLAPRADEPVTAAIIGAIAGLWRFIPGEAHRGSPTEAGREDFGLAYAPGDSLVGHALGSSAGGRQWAVLPMPRVGWAAIPANGWRVDQVGPVPYVLRLTK